MSFLSKLKINKNYLRRVKYRLSDDIGLIKYQTGLFKNSISNFSNLTIKNKTIGKEENKKRIIPR